MLQMNYNTKIESCQIYERDKQKVATMGLTESKMTIKAVSREKQRHQTKTKQETETASELLAYTRSSMQVKKKDSLYFYHYHFRFIFSFALIQRTCLFGHRADTKGCLCCRVEDCGKHTIFWKWAIPYNFSFIWK